MLTEDSIKFLIEKASDLEIELVWLPKIVGNQTDDEIEKLNSVLDNKIGLNARDAPFVTSVYLRILSGEHLSSGQASILREILPKYWRQFVRMTL